MARIIAMFSLMVNNPQHHPAQSRYTMFTGIDNVASCPFFSRITWLPQRSATSHPARLKARKTSSPEYAPSLPNSIHSYFNKKKASCASIRKHRFDPFMPNYPSSINQACQYVFTLQPWISFEDVFYSVACGQHSQNVLHRQSTAPYDWLSPEDIGIYCYSFKESLLLHGGTSVIGDHVSQGISFSIISPCQPAVRPYSLSHLSSSPSPISQMSPTFTPSNGQYGCRRYYYN